MRVLVLLASMFLAADVAVTALPTRADDEPPPVQDFTRDGWYLQVQGLYAIENFEDADDFTVDNNDFDNGAGFNILGGYRMGRNFAGELEFEFIERFGIDAAADAGINDSQYIRTYNLALNLRVYPLARLFDPGSVFNRFQPFAKAGAAWQWAALRSGGDSIENDGDFAGRFGAGLDIYITKSIVVTAGANYMLPAGDVDGLDYLSFGGGLQYRFGGDDSAY